MISCSKSSRQRARRESRAAPALPALRRFSMSRVSRSARISRICCVEPGFAQEMAIRLGGDRRSHSGTFTPLRGELAIHLAERGVLAADQRHVVDADVGKPFDECRFRLSLRIGCRGRWSFECRWHLGVWLLVEFTKRADGRRAPGGSSARSLPARPSPSPRRANPNVRASRCR